MSSKIRRPGVGAAVSCVLACLSVTAASAGPYVEPPVFASAGGVLDIVMVARAQQVRTLSPFLPDGWVYDVCPRLAPDQMDCPRSHQQWYGGMRLQLQQGDHLKIRLVNKLPPAFGAKHSVEKGLEYLTLNPTNLHTHGLLVRPHYPTLGNPTYGDNVFVLTLNPDNGRPGRNQHIHGDVRNGFTDYDIRIPLSHPSGLFWIHPHAHGIALNQISAGMAGIITIGDPRDYLCGKKGCGSGPDDIPPVRHLILKDTQVLPGDVLVDQQNPAFCPLQPDPGDPPRQGFCLNPIGGIGGAGRWFFTINGQQYPTIPVAAPRGEIWRITNASASITYSLTLANPTQGRNMLMQVVAVDGVSVSPDPVTSLQQLARLGGGKFTPEPCPAESGGPGHAKQASLCVRRLVMFPSSRIELWVTYRDETDTVVAPPAGAAAVFKTTGMETGPDGDAWPTIDLADVEFSNSPQAGAPAATIEVNGEASALLHPERLAAELAAHERGFAAEADCRPLPAGHMRRIFFNSIPPAFPDEDEPSESPFGLGYEEIDENGVPVPGTFVDVSIFNPARPTICLTLGPGNTPVNERWQLVNLASEDHNFHMHQTKFRLISRDAVGGTTTRRRGILHDNVPVRHARGLCESVADWRAGRCTAYPVVVEIPFSVAGDYVYHCHILEHEDGGMMARIRVRRSP
jgi:FtsP/CotA-like multicopper oxidase with cupredoxin domain